MKKAEQPKLESKYNVSYLEAGLPQPSLLEAIRHLASAAVVYGTILIFVTVSPYFQSLLSVRFYNVSAIAIYWYVFAAYMIIDIPICIFIRPKSLWISNPVRITGYIMRFVRGILKSSNSENSGDSLKPTYEEKHAIAFFIVKMIYGPMAVNAAIDGFNKTVPIYNLYHQLPLDITPAQYFDIIYKLFITAAFMIEAFPYIISYHTDSQLFGNKLRYVETNPFHLLVCLACYPPFNEATVLLLGGSFENPFAIVWRGDLNHPLTWILRILAMIFAGILISASLTLFTRASNLTNRGIVTWGVYRIVRHPGYASKNIYWLITFIPLLVSGTLSPLGYFMFLFGYVGWATLYFFRGITEERFLMRDPDYVEYCKKVKYHFIPFIY
jgi:protein-S-isoprenylcysteine O-methyltransferase Ste14